MTPRLMLGDCLDAMRQLDDCSIDAVITDPPYGISFMSKHWDRFDIEQRVGQRDVSQLGVRLTGAADSPNRKEISRTASAFANAAGEAGDYDLSPKGNRAFQEWTRGWAAEAFRVLKPGGHMLCFASTRTYHRMACGVEDAGFEIRDCLAWMFGSGFPKSLDVSKAIDAAAGAAREVVGYDETKARPNKENFAKRTDRQPSVGALDGWKDNGATITAPATDDAVAWDGWGTALKPAFEPIVMARKPLSGTVAATVLMHGTGALNVDACRIEVEDVAYARNHSGDRGHDGTRSSAARGATDLRPGGGSASEVGRWPANVILDDEAAALLDEQTGELTSGGYPPAGVTRSQGATFERQSARGEPQFGGSTGGASRFFYCAKVSRAERNAGLDDGFEKRPLNWSSGEQTPGSFQSEGTDRTARNSHPTVKPIDLMRWLARLVTPTGGTILDPFLGSGTTGCAAALEGFDFVGVEREADYMAIAAARIAFWAEHGDDGLRIVRERDAADRVRQQVADAGQLDLLGELVS